MDTPVTSHRRNQDNDNTVENVEISQTSNHTHSKSRKVKVPSMRGNESQEPPVTVEREESNDEIENVAGTSKLQPQEDDEITRPPRSYNRRLRSIVWNHCTKNIV